MIKLLGTALCVLFCSALLKDRNRVFALILSVTGAVMLLIGVTGELSAIKDRLINIASPYNESLVYLKLMLKVLAITLITQGVSDICRDNGESALAGITEFSAKVTVAVLVLPLFETVIGLVGGIVK